VTLSWSCSQRALRGSRRCPETGAWSCARADRITRQRHGLRRPSGALMGMRLGGCGSSCSGEAVPGESGGGPPQSKTLPRGSRLHPIPGISRRKRVEANSLLGRWGEVSPNPASRFEPPNHQAPPLPACGHPLLHSEWRRGPGERRCSGSGQRESEATACHHSHPAGSNCSRPTRLPAGFRGGPATQEGEGTEIFSRMSGRVN
jgi:hypothetical protein